MIEILSTVVLTLFALFSRSCLEARVQEAFADWGHDRPMQVTLDFEPDKSDGVIAYAASSYLMDGTWLSDRCTIVFRPIFWDYSSSLQKRFITHEVGHCLGLTHHEGPGVLGPDWNDTEISPVERAMYRAIWPPAIRVVMPGLAFQ